jgi:hypothetical protein
MSLITRTGNEVVRFTEQAEIDELMAHLIATDFKGLGVLGDDMAVVGVTIGSVGVTRTAKGGLRANPQRSLDTAKGESLSFELARVSESADEDVAEAPAAEAESMESAAPDDDFSDVDELGD